MYSLKQLVRYAALLALPVLGSCEKGLDTIICEDGSTTPTTIPDSIQALTRQLGAQSQLFTYDPTRQNQFTGLKGTVITIPANAFVRQGGGPVTGPVELEVREVFSKADMVLTGTPTSSFGQLLESAGEVYLQPAKDSSLRLAPQASLQFQTQNPPNLVSPDSMRLFSGSGPVCFNWAPVFDQGSSIRQSGNGFRVTISSTVFNSSIGWFNCDRFYGVSNPVSVTVDVQGSNIDPANNTMVFVVFKELNGSLRACEFKAPNTFTTGGVPSGSAVAVAVIRTLNGKLYYGRQDGTVTANQRFSPTMREVTPDEIRVDLNTL
ncbi:hypothetical protein [Hymenobacter fodinae]|uniref:Uncharacterized protein n=1 Tax=Hymenobacter fodinae TaxID=2510796 RepID=A0A4Z0P905_9BACT|nr:hypothetical protein [Hymenobacter fodinae]TGE08470.1 hypothetical protein EU556_12220 [Hymenobacter fodinae]